jgi:hypothetical protein
MTRYDDLRRMREAKFKAQSIPKPVTINVTENPPPKPVTINTPPISVTTKPRGRPKTGKAMSGAERTRRYRAKKAR